MKSINLLSLVQAKNSLDPDIYSNFLNHYSIGIKEQEVGDLEILINCLKEAKGSGDFNDNFYDFRSKNIIFDKFYVGYKIPQISKEFDLLRFGTKCLINIELKRKGNENIILKQLKQNKHYLNVIKKQQKYYLSFVSETKQLYRLKKDNSLKEVNISVLKKLLKNQNSKNFENIDDLFDPSEYLVSPFNSTQKFLQNDYFLTSQQEGIKKKVLNSLKSVNGSNFISVTGNAGTGKTLLIYDIVKSLQDGCKPLIIHCGNLNEGQEQLNTDGWKILPIKSYSKCDLSNYGAVFIDEAQRLKQDQFNYIVKKIEKINGNCIFSYDKVQTLHKSEQYSDIDSKIKNIISQPELRLTDKIRTNKEIAAFIKMLFCNKRNVEFEDKGNIEINYFKDLNDAKSYLYSLDEDHWEVLKFTPSMHTKEHHMEYLIDSKKASHAVIGQEFDGVALVIDDLFQYDEGGKLGYKGQTYYDAEKMLFQNITRTRKRLNLVIIDNEELLDRCVSILNRLKRTRHQKINSGR